VEVSELTFFDFVLTSAPTSRALLFCVYRQRAAWGPSCSSPPPLARKPRAQSLSASTLPRAARRTAARFRQHFARTRASEIHRTPSMAIATMAAPAPNTVRRASTAPTASTADRVNRAPPHRLACARTHATGPPMPIATMAAPAPSTVRGARTAPTASTADRVNCGRRLHLSPPARP